MLLGRHRLHAARRRVQGFTLIEVMVALAIVAMTLAAGLRVQAGLTDRAGTAGTGYAFDVRPRWPLAELSLPA